MPRSETDPAESKFPLFTLWLILMGLMLALGITLLILGMNSAPPFQTLA